MITRILPVEEYPRLVGTEAEQLWPHLPESARVIVVEDNGCIVATWTLMQMVHAECIWIAPTHRGSFGVVRRLLGKMRETASEWEVSKIITASLSPYVSNLIRRIGGTRIEGESFLLPVSGIMRAERRVAIRQPRLPSRL